MNSSKRHFHSRGLTLLELMVVVAIIGILGSITIHRYLVARDRAHVGAAQADVSLLRQALAFHAADYDAYPETITSLTNMLPQMVDPRGQPYMTLPSGETFEWVSYEPDEVEGYVLRVRAKDNRGTILRATADSIERES